jgi:hypothetical protein
MTAHRLAIAVAAASVLGACAGLPAAGTQTGSIDEEPVRVAEQSLTRAPVPAGAYICPKTLSHLKPALVGSSPVDLDAPVKLHFASFGGRDAAARSLAVDVEMTQEALERELETRKAFEISTDLSARAELDRRISGLEDDLMVQAALMEAAQCRRY